MFISVDSIDASVRVRLADNLSLWGLISNRMNEHPHLVLLDRLHLEHGQPIAIADRALRWPTWSSDGCGPEGVVNESQEEDDESRAWILP
jgi:hypothetical protein